MGREDECRFEPPLIFRGSNPQALRGFPLTSCFKHFNMFQSFVQCHSNVVLVTQFDDNMKLVTQKTRSRFVTRDRSFFANTFSFQNSNLVCNFFYITMHGVI